MCPARYLTLSLHPASAGFASPRLHRGTDLIMALEVVVGPPLLTINRGDTFVVSEADGCITSNTDQGMYSRDTRHVSHYEIFADGEHWILQNSGAIANYASRTYLTNPRIVTEYNEIQAGTVALILEPRRRRWYSRGFRYSQLQHEASPLLSRVVAAD